MPSQRLAPFLVFTLVLIGYSYFFAAVRQAAGKRPVAALIAHGRGNAFVPLFPTIVMAQGAGQQRYWLWAGFTLLAGVVAMIARSRVSCRTSGFSSRLNGGRRECGQDGGALLRRVA